MQGDVVRVVAGGAPLTATIDPAVHRSVVEGALARQERVLVEIEPDGGAVIVGALRTRPTPGLESADEFVIEAKRVAVRADEISLATAAAAVVLRAVGEVETYADRIVSRAEGLHRLVGRMLKLN
jgi:hypothetical protein